MLPALFLGFPSRTPGDRSVLNRDAPPTLLIFRISCVVVLRVHDLCVVRPPNADLQSANVCSAGMRMLRQHQAHMLDGRCDSTLTTADVALAVVILLRGTPVTGASPRIYVLSNAIFDRVSITPRYSLQIFFAK